MKFMDVLKFQKNRKAESYYSSRLSLLLKIKNFLLNLPIYYSEMPVIQLGTSLIGHVVNSPVSAFTNAMPSTTRPARSHL